MAKKGRRGPLAAVFLSLFLVLALAWTPIQAQADPSVPTSRGTWTFNNTDALSNTGSESTLTLSQGNGISIQESGIQALGKAVSFSASATGNLHVNSAINAASNDFTIALWIRADHLTTYPQKTALLQLNGEGHTLLYQRNDGTFVSYITGSDIDLGSDPARGTWEHLVFVKSSADSSVAVYIDGKLVGKKTYSGTIPAGTSNLIIGAHKDAASMGRFQGSADELRLWGTALNASQVSALYGSYTAVNTELSAQKTRAQLETLVTQAQQKLSNAGDEAKLGEFVQLTKATTQAQAALKGTDANSVSASLTQLTTALNAVNSMGLIAHINTSSVERTRDKGLFGINHRYAFNGYGSFDPKTMSIKDSFAQLYDQAGFGSIRYPGGTISNLFDWKETLGKVSDRVPQIHGFYDAPNQGGIIPTFGLSEIGTFAQEHNSEIVYVYSLGRGDADDAADLIEFLNAEVGTNPNGGTAWAEVRKQLGHPEPYNVRYFEIGNEMNNGNGTDGRGSQQYWTTHVKGGALEGYVNGGNVTYTKQYAVVKGNWNSTASYSTGKAGQQFGMRYARLQLDTKSAKYKNWTAFVPGSVSVFVGNEQWKPVADLATSGPNDKVYQLDSKTGFFTFGDGKHGMIPPQGQQVSVSYQVQRDGFVQISQSMRSTMEQINQDRQKAGESPKELHVYSSWEGTNFVEKMNKEGKNALYDGLTIHPYSGKPAGGSSTESTREAFYLSAMKLGDNKTGTVANYVKLMKRYDPTKVPVISEYGIYNSTDDMVRSQTQALYIARAIMDYTKLGSPYIQKHCLVDWYSNGRDALGPTQQAVIQAVPGKDANTKTGEGTFTFFDTPSASVFQMFNSSYGSKIVSSDLVNNTSLSNGVAQYKTMASTSDDGTVYLAIVNLDMGTKTPSTADSVRLVVNGQDLTGRKISVQSLSGDSFWAANTPEKPNAVSVKTTGFTATEAMPRVDLQPHSFTIITVSPAASNSQSSVEHATGTTQPGTAQLSAPLAAQPTTDKQAQDSSIQPDADTANGTATKPALAQSDGTLGQFLQDLVGLLSQGVHSLFDQL